ncbi:MAG: hypothetical protein V4683_03935 [Bacteroidota bacterium]
MEKIIISRFLENKLSDLIEILYKDEYFGFIEDAENYVDKIYDFIQSIPYIPHRECFNSKVGKYFVRYDNPKSNMQYFITFNKSGNRFIIENIISPKTTEYSQIIEG